MNDWLVLKLEHTPEHRWVIQVTYGRNGGLKFHRRIEMPHWEKLWKRG